jgi:hypothetical protein
LGIEGGAHHLVDAVNGNGDDRPSYRRHFARPGWSRSSFIAQPKRATRDAATRRLLLGLPNVYVPGADARMTE